YVRFITQSIIDVSLASALSRFALKRRCDEEPVSMPSFKRMKPLFLGSSNTGCNIFESANEVIQLSNICLTTNQDQDHVSDSSSSAQLFDTDTSNDFSREPGQIPRRVMTKRRGRPRVKNISTKGNELISDDLVEVPIKVMEIDQNLYFSKAVSSSPGCGFSYETKNKQNKLEKIRSSLCFTSSYYVDPVGCSGGLALWWTSSLNFNINFGDKNLIIVKGDFPTRSHLSCLPICFVYAPHDRVSRSRVWDSIIRQSSFNGPCLTIGDLNLIGELGVILSSFGYPAWPKEHNLRSKKFKGEWIFDPSDIQRLVRDHFGAIFTNSGPRNFEELIEVLDLVVFDEMNSHLQAHVTEVEIHKATKQLGGLKAPSVDVFSGEMPPKLNKSLVALILKTTSPKNLSQFRPISLCNFIYKIISKVLSNRLKPWMSKSISPQQSAFIPKRQIQDCMVVAHEAFHYICHKKCGSQNVMALKLDLNKAFDRVEWDFLLATLRKMGFDDVWCKWIQACVTTYEFKFMVNGESVGIINPERGLRQGDPISLYLFIIVVKECTYK
ncbi:reverse transcriptase, partial [Tanacetum coccineum]